MHRGGYIIISTGLICSGVLYLLRADFIMRVADVVPTKKGTGLSVPCLEVLEVFLAA